MKAKPSEGWPRIIQVSREKVTVYRRQPPSGPSYRVSDYSSGKRRFADFADEENALGDAKRIARLLSERDVLGAGIRKEEAGAYALKLTGGLSAVLQAVEAWTRDYRTVTRKPVAEVVKELIGLKERGGMSRRHVNDLRSSLNRFAASVKKDTCDVSTSDVQAFLDS